MNPDVDCMTCLVNIARGLKVENGLRIPWRGTTHAAVLEIGPGLACDYERHNSYGSHVEWRRRSDTR
jgi:hypothetical protein